MGSQWSPQLPLCFVFLVRIIAIAIGIGIGIGLAIGIAIVMPRADRCTAIRSKRRESVLFGKPLPERRLGFDPDSDPAR